MQSFLSQGTPSQSLVKGNCLARVTPALSTALTLHPTIPSRLPKVSSIFLTRLLPSEYSTNKTNLVGSEWSSFLFLILFFFRLVLAGFSSLPSPVHIFSFSTSSLILFRFLYLLVAPIIFFICLPPRLSMLLLYKFLPSFLHLFTLFSNPLMPARIISAVLLLS